MSSPAVRIPLQVGLAALRHAVRANVFGWAGLLAFIFGGFVLPGLIALVLPEATPEQIQIILSGIFVMASATLALFTWVVASDASDLFKKEGPSDLVISGDRLCVEGGLFDGRRIMLSAIRGCDVVELELERAGIRQALVRIVTFGRLRAARRPVFTLQLTTPDREIVELAHTDDPEEVASFRELAATLSALAREQAIPPPAPPAGGPALFACPKCDAPQAPVDADHVACHHCGKHIDVPEDLRERMRAPEVAARAPAVQRRLQRMLARPGWPRAAAWLRWGRRAIRLAWPFALIGFVVICVKHAQTPADYPVVRIIEGYPAIWVRDLFLAAGVVVAVIAVVAANVAAILAARRAVRVISLRLGANPPATPGAPPTCRQCGAPLPTAGDQVLVRCVYCAADNVMATDLRLAASHTRGQAASLADATRHRRRARIRLAIVAAISAAAITLLVREIRWSWRLAPEGEDHSCALCQFANLQNDNHRRTLVVVDTTTHRYAIPAGAKAHIECKQPCSLELEGLPTYRLDGQWVPLVVQDGQIKTAYTTP